MKDRDMPIALHHAGEAHKIVKHIADLDPSDVTGYQDVAGSAYMYGMVLSSAGEKTKAIQFFHESAVMVKELAEAGKLDSKGQRLLPGLANGLFKLGKVDEASVLADLALDALARVPQSSIGGQFAGIAISIIDSLVDMQKNEVAETLCDKMLPFCIKVHGEHSDEIAILMNFSGIVRKRRNDLAGAEYFYRRSYEEICRLHGAESPGALAAYRNLVWVVNKRRVG
jgi:hypothetical protein